MCEPSDLQALIKEIRNLTHCISEWLHHKIWLDQKHDYVKPSWLCKYYMLKMASSLRPRRRCAVDLTEDKIVDGAVLRVITDTARQANPPPPHSPLAAEAAPTGVLSSLFGLQSPARDVAFERDVEPFTPPPLATQFMQPELSQRLLSHRAWMLEVRPAACRARFAAAAKRHPLSDASSQKLLQLCHLLPLPLLPRLDPECRVITETEPAVLRAGPRTSYRTSYTNRSVLRGTRRRSRPPLRNPPLPPANRYSCAPSCFCDIPVSTPIDACVTCLLLRDVLARQRRRISLLERELALLRAHHRSPKHHSV